MTECEKYALVLEQAEDDNGVIGMTTQVRDTLVRLLRGIPEKPVKPIFMPGGLFACPRCIAIVKLGNSFCWNCGRGLKWNETD